MPPFPSLPIASCPFTSEEAISNSSIFAVSVLGPQPFFFSFCSQSYARSFPISFLSNLALLYPLLPSLSTVSTSLRTWTFSSFSSCHSRFFPCFCDPFTLSFPLVTFNLSRSPFSILRASSLLYPPRFPGHSFSGQTPTPHLVLHACFLFTSLPSHS